ncbi:MAG: NADH:ubiquinone oxidoreductase [Polyangiaceae bacterium]|nr:NADH:ubiquinone oxidoreductase [Polyangiaceae bacterium]
MQATTSRPRIALYWASGCGGCEIAFVNLHERLLELDARFEIFFCPCLVDTKRQDVEALPDGALALTLLDGAQRSDENVEMAQLLRRKSQLLVAYGSCAHEGCLPGLANLRPTASLLDTVYAGMSEPSRPRARAAVPQGELHLPTLLPRVLPLADVVDVDYVIPGCPPEPDTLWRALGQMFTEPPPPRGAVLGAGESAVCRECALRREDKTIVRLRRVHELIPEPTRCLLEQGILCMGPATRDGCGALCTRVGMPCIGCYGAPEGVPDQGAAMAGAVGSILDIEPLRDRSDKEIAAAVDATLDAVPDWAGSCYKFSLAASLLGGRRT